MLYLPVRCNDIMIIISINGTFIIHQALLHGFKKGLNACDLFFKLL